MSVSSRVAARRCRVLLCAKTYEFATTMLCSSSWNRSFWLIGCGDAVAVLGAQSVRVEPQDTGIREAVGGGCSGCARRHQGIGGGWGWGRTSRQDILPSALLTLTRSLLIPTSGSTMSQSYHSSNHSSSTCQDREVADSPGATPERGRR